MKMLVALGFLSLVALSFADMPGPYYTYGGISPFWLIPALGVGIVIGYLIGKKKWTK